MTIAGQRDTDAHDEAVESREMLADVFASGSTVLVVGACEPGLLELLRAKGCQVTVAGDTWRSSHHSGGAVDGSVDAVLLPGLSGPAIDESLARARRLLTMEGRLVVSVRNAAYAGHRLDLLRGRLDRVDLAALLLPLDAAEALLTDAGLVVIERHAVSRPMDIDAPEAVRHELLAHEDALTWAHILVAAPATQDEPSSVAAAQALRHRVTELTSRLAEIEEAVRDRVTELDSVHAERRHLELDLAVKDAFIAELLERLSILEAEHAEHEALTAELARRQALAVEQMQMTRYRVADAVHARISGVPVVHRPLRAAASWLRERRKRSNA